VHAGPAEIAGTTVDGSTALDVPAAVRSALAHHGIELDVVGPCTGCDDRWFSHRVRTDLGRHATVASIGRDLR
jgi:copper oxidase (laccase) domain-containing protein